MHLFPDFKDLLAAFEESRVEYVIVGGYAVIFHGRPRATKDIGILVDVHADNLTRLAHALAEFGASPNIINSARTMQKDEIVYFGTSPLRVDLLGSAAGIELEDVAQRAVHTDLDGIAVRFISLDDLIVNKRAAGRPRDLEDAEELEVIRKKRGG